MDGPWKQPNVEAGASALLPVPLPLGGVLVVGEETVSYLNGGSSFAKVFSLFLISFLIYWCESICVYLFSFRWFAVPQCPQLL